ncbi:AraC family transcriptional regulator [uncultured Clostridium sp.]|uniref:AraC family transcriptional regulator n=1 Tax=uncultured Clostridium sp. TaxID=59620 RepID=UPI0028EE0A59|nr:AraC family transcriptional regulator [uncultured Clostridium sp.]
MEWTECISKAISYIEDNITEELTIEDIAKQAMVSSFYFQKGFAMLCGFTVGEYIKKRRLTLAGSELVSTDRKIIDIALKYGYDSPDSFTKAFTRFHGETPTSVRKGETMIKSFASLKIKLTLEGGYTMDYKIVKKDAFTIIGVSKVFKYDEAATEVPKLWTEYYQTGKSDIVCSVYGVSIDENIGGNEFEYLIADNYNPIKEIAEGFITRVIPKHTWAVFACRGAGSHSLQDVHKKIFSEWLPNSKDYEIAAGYNIEMYSDPAEYEKGVQDEKYYSEIWIPVQQK